MLALSVGVGLGIVQRDRGGNAMLLAATRDPRPGVAGAVVANAPPDVAHTRIAALAPATAG